jgi:hypothetical protein
MRPDGRPSSTFFKSGELKIALGEPQIGLMYQRVVFWEP